MTLETSLRKSPVHQNPSQSSVCSSFFSLLFLFLFFGSFLFVLEGFFLFWSVVLGFYENWMNTLDNRVDTILYPHVGIPKRVNKPWAISNDAERTEVQQTQSLPLFPPKLKTQVDFINYKYVLNDITFIKTYHPKRKRSASLLRNLCHLLPVLQICLFLLGQKSHKPKQENKLATKLQKIYFCVPTCQYLIRLEAFQQTISFILFSKTSKKLA